MIPLFDLGHVIVKVDFAPFFSWLQENAGRQDPAWAESFLKSPIYTDYESGALSRAEFAVRVGAFVGRPVDPDELAAAYCGIFPGSVPGMPALLGVLSQRGPIYALSNTNEMHLEYLFRHFPEMRFFTKVYASQDLGLRKPNSKIYLETARLIGTPPENLVFFDDLEPNIRGAREAGLQAHLFSSAESAAEILAIAGILE